MFNICYHGVYLRRLFFLETTNKDCNAKITKETIIASPNYPHYYGAFRNCKWSVYLPNATALSVEVLDLSIHRYPTWVISCTLKLVNYSCTFCQLSVVFLWIHTTIIILRSCILYSIIHVLT